MKNQTDKPDYEKLVEEITGQNSSMCYQCGKCSAGCPVREFASTPPNRVVRYFQLGMYEKALNSPTIWLCAGCMTCTSRCPKNFKLSSFMDALREIAIKEGIQSGDKKSVAFHQTFLNQVKKFGRAFEFGFIRDYKLKSGQFFQDMDVAPSMFMKGKIGLLPHKVKEKEKIQKIFNDIK